MPELPEVETMRRGILSIVGRPITAVERPPCPRKPIVVRPRWDALRRRMVGRSVVDVGRVGKRIVLSLDSDDALVIEPRMTGLVLLADPPDAMYLRLRLTFAPQRGKAHELLFWDRRGLGVVSLYTPAQRAARLGPDRLGPDALDVTVAALRDRLDASRRAIKVALLDQRAVAGIGNLYASEILHLAKISPRKRCDNLTRGEWSRLHEATLAVLREAIRYEGSTLADGTYRNALNQTGSYQNHHRVYDRAGDPCPTCGFEPVRRIVQAQRSTFYCPRCQKG